MGIKTLDSVLRDSLYHMPYSSVTPFYLLLTSHVPDPRFGNACVWQSKAVADELNARGLRDVRFLNDRRHLAAVARFGGDLYLFDPYLLHTEAVNLSEILRDGTGHDYASFPVCRDAHGRRRDGVLEVRPSADRRHVTLVYRQFAVPENRYRPRHRFTFDMESPLAHFPTVERLRERYTGMLFHPEQTTLSIRVLDRERGSLSQLSYPIAEHHGGPVISRERLRVAVSDGWSAPYGAPEFRSAVARICDSLACSTGDLFDFVLGGVALYVRHAPAAIDTGRGAPPAN